ncbi:MAG: inositol monophosphatase [Pelagibacterales bacterium]|nr:inositol monophosphatase [Pelagibacterales bacterium]OUU61405.1 MAG: hypothetical protein CBC22_07700 [Alphaproteobacteria bacterium TMED62]|tara:strand:- start:8332 stop:9060 length:729 start_codon:yes stop_codon:yes gene_type:complete
MIQSSNIHVMSAALLKVAKILRRDFNELEKIQSSKQNVDKFVFKSIENMRESLNYDLQKARPEAEIIFVEEEEQVKEKDYIFLVDPVSGIKNYAHGISYFASSIILIVRGKAISSVIYDPIRDEMYYAEKGKGAYLNNMRIRVSSNNKKNRAMFVLESFDTQDFSYIDNNDLQLKDFRVLGSYALDLANTANGKIDCYFAKNLDLEKSAAGLFLVKEAGGVIHEDNKLKCNVVTNNNMLANY